ncbi:MAG: helicase [Microbacterium sp.]|nr:helicase [Microbacterium sp.]
MAGSMLAAGVLAVTATLGLGLAAVGGAAVTAQRVARAADAAALAAADASSGAVAVSAAPCEVAARVASAAGGVLTGCEVDGFTATVAVEARFAGWPAVARARAGPPPAG